MTAPLSVCGVVLHMSVYGESHRLVDVLTAECGRITLLARGARASRRRFAGILDLFASLHMQVQMGRGPAVLQNADALAPRLGIRRDLAAIGRASRLCQYVRVLAPAHQEASALLRLLEHALDLLDRQQIAQAAAVYPALLTAAGILAGPEALPSAALRDVARGAPLSCTDLADTMEAWAQHWLVRQTGTSLGPHIF